MNLRKKQPWTKGPYGWHNAIVAKYVFWEAIAHVENEPYIASLRWQTYLQSRQVKSAFEYDLRLKEK